MLILRYFSIRRPRVINCQTLFGLQLYMNYKNNKVHYVPNYTRQNIRTGCETTTMKYFKH